MNKIYFINNIFDLITLHMTDHMPVDVFWQNFIFGSEFLCFVLSIDTNT